MSAPARTCAISPKTIAGAQVRAHTHADMFGIRANLRAGSRRLRRRAQDRPSHDVVADCICLFAVASVAFACKSTSSVSLPQSPIVVCLRSVSRQPIVRQSSICGQYPTVVCSQSIRRRSVVSQSSVSCRFVVCLSSVARRCTIPRCYGSSPCRDRFRGPMGTGRGVTFHMTSQK